MNICSFHPLNIKNFMQTIKFQLKENYFYFIILNLGNLDVDVVKEKFGIDNIYRAMVLVCDWINIDENVQVNGISVFIDMSNMTTKHHLHLMNFENMKKMLQYYQVRS